MLKAEIKRDRQIVSYYFSADRDVDVQFVIDLVDKYVIGDLQLEQHKFIDSATGKKDYELAGVVQMYPRSDQNSDDFTAAVRLVRQCLDQHFSRDELEDEDRA